MTHPLNAYGVLNGQMLPPRHHHHQHQHFCLVDDDDDRDVYVAYPHSSTAVSHGGADASIYLPTYKVLLVGDAGVGKSYLLHRYCFNTYDPLLPSTIGVEFYSRQVDLPARTVAHVESVVLQLWDTAGQERHCGVVSRAFYRSAVGAFIVFDVTCRESLLNVPRWVARVRELAGEDCVCAVIGTKSDLLTANRGTSTATDGSARKIAALHEEVDMISHALGLQNFFVSALTGEGVLQAFTHLVLAVSAMKEVEADRLRYTAAAAGSSASAASSPVGVQLWTSASSAPHGALCFHTTADFFSIWCVKEYLSAVVVDAAMIHTDRRCVTSSSIDQHINIYK